MILYGASGHCKVIVDILEASGVHIDFIVDDNPDLTELLGYEVRRNSCKYTEAIIAIGSCVVRKRVANSILVGRYLTAIHPSAIISPHSSIGDGSVVMQGGIVQSCAVIGKHCIVNTGASVGHDAVIGDYVHIAPHSTVTGAVEIGEGTWIGAGTVIKQGIKVGRWCMIGAGSVVVKDIPDGSLAFGNPCRIINKINEEQFMNNLNSKIGGGKLACLFSNLLEERRLSA